MHTSTKKLIGAALGGCLTLGLTACAGTVQKPITTVSKVELKRFMGNWYVIANIPTFIEKGAHNAVESYAMNADGTVATTFEFNAGGFDGQRKDYHPTGYIVDTESNAVWGMQFLWPFKSEYRIIWLNDDYTQTIIGRTKRDYVWIMARTPSIPQADYEQLMRFLNDEGYDIRKVQKVPQQWPAAQAGGS